MADHYNSLSLCLVCRVVAVYCTMVDVRLAVLGYAAHGSKFLRIYCGNVEGRHIWRWGDRWLPSKEVGGSISSRSSGGELSPHIQARLSLSQKN